MSQGRLATASTLVSAAADAAEKARRAPSQPACLTPSNIGPLCRRVLHAAWQARAAVSDAGALITIRSAQLSEGGYSLYPGGPADIDLSCIAWVSAAVLGGQVGDFSRTRERVGVLGGVGAAKPATRALLRAFGLIPQETSARSEHRTAIAGAAFALPAVPEPRSWSTRLAGLFGSPVSSEHPPSWLEAYSDPCDPEAWETSAHEHDRLAVEDVLARQEQDGGWAGRSGVNYIWGTWKALEHLRRAGFSDREAPVLRAGEWLRSVQNPDGGWGESCASYDAGTFVEAASTPSQTAWAILGLLDGGDATSLSLESGIQFLVRTQQPDGTWQETAPTATITPGELYCNHSLHRARYPLMALNNFVEAKREVA